MRTLNFIVESDHLRKTGDFSHIVRGSHGWLECSFSLSKDWDKTKIAAVFTSSGRDYPVIVTKGVCKIPDSVTKSKCFKVKLVGRKDSSERLTNQVLVEQEG